MKDRLTRREFLRRGFLAALGAGLAACAGPQRTAEITRVGPTDEALPISPKVEPTPIPGLHEARFYRQLDGGRVQCQVCFRRCTVPEEGRGFCRNKVNVGGRCTPYPMITST